MKQIIKVKSYKLKFQKMQQQQSEATMIFVIASTNWNKYIFCPLQIHIEDTTNSIKLSNY